MKKELAGNSLAAGVRAVVEYGGIKHEGKGLHFSLLDMPFLAAVHLVDPEIEIDPRRIRGLDLVVKTGVKRNDLMDKGMMFRGGMLVIRDDRECLELKKRYRMARSDLGHWVEDSDSDRQTIVDYVKAVTECEVEMRKKESWGRDEVRIYREKVNAESLLAGLRILFGRQVFRDGSEWLTDGRESRDRYERLARGMFEIVMACQVMDDKYGYELDKKMGLPSFFNKGGSGEDDYLAEGYWAKVGEMGVSAVDVYIMKKGIGLVHWGLEMMGRLRPEKYQEVLTRRGRV